MLPVFDGIRDISFLSVAVRMLLAFACGAVIGLERTYRRRPAGFRTHILIVMGAAVTTLTSQFLYLYMHYYTDMARLGAQVIAGIGFIGAGTIIVTQHQRVKGLTTAAGLWASAIIGLAIGGGFYEGGIAATLLVIFSELFCSKVEHRALDTSREVNFYMEYFSKVGLEEVLALCRDKKVKIVNLEITRSNVSKKHNATAIFTLRLNKNVKADELMSEIGMVKGIASVEEL